MPDNEMIMMCFRMARAEKTALWHVLINEGETFASFFTRMARAYVQDAARRACTAPQEVGHAD